MTCDYNEYCLCCLWTDEQVSSNRLPSHHAKSVGGFQESERIKRAEKNRKAAWFSCSAGKNICGSIFPTKNTWRPTSRDKLRSFALTRQAAYNSRSEKRKINSRNPPALLHDESTTPRVRDVSRSRCTTLSRLARVYHT